MNKLLIYQYINKLNKDDIKRFGLNQGIDLNNYELDIIYDYIKNDNKRILNNPLEVIDEIKNKLSTQVFNKIIELYNKYKSFLID